MQNIKNPHDSPTHPKPWRNDVFAESISIGLIIYLTFTLIGFILAMLLTSFFPTNDKATVISNFFVWSATLFAPVAALFLIDSWKNQKKYEITQETSMVLISNLQPIFVELVELRSLFNNFKKIDSELIIFPEVLNRNYPNLSNLSFKTFSHFKLLSKLTNDSELENKYNFLEKQCMYIDSVRTIFFDEYYSIYLKELKSKKDDISIDKFSSQPYKNNEKILVYMQIMNLKNALESHSISTTSSDTQETIFYANYESLHELITSTIKNIENIQITCMEQIRL